MKKTAVESVPVAKLAAMKTYELSVFFALISGAIVVHVFTVQVDQPIAWVKKNADTLARKFCSGVVKEYCALNVKEV